MIIIIIQQVSYITKFTWSSISRITVKMIVMGGRRIISEICGKEMSVTETGIVTTLNGNVSLRADVAVELGALTVVYAAHCYNVKSVRVTNHRCETLHTSSSNTITSHSCQQIRPGAQISLSNTRILSLPVWKKTVAYVTVRLQV